MLLPCQKIYLGRLNKNGKADFILDSKRHAWIQIAKGSLTVNGIKLAQGDGAAVSDEEKLTFESASGGEFLLFDLT